MTEQTRIPISENLHFFAAVISAMDGYVEEGNRNADSDNGGDIIIPYQDAINAGREFISSDLPSYYQPFKDIVRRKISEISLALGAMQNIPLSSMLRRIN